MSSTRTLVGTRSPAALRRLGAEGVGLVSVLLILGLSARSGGGFFPVEYLTMGIGALVAGAVVVLVRPTTPRPSRRTAVGVSALVAYALWLGLSALWSPVPSVATAEFQRTLAYAAVLTLGVLVVGHGRGARGLVVAVWVALAGIAIAGVLARLLPGLELAPQVDPIFMTYRLTWPISYWNAQGAAAAMAAVLALGIAGDRRSHVALRALAAASVPITVLCLLLTVSRGSVASLVIGIVVLVALSRRPLQTLAVAACCGVPTGLALLLAASQPAIVDDPAARPALADAGPKMLAEVLALGVVAAVASVIAFSALQRLERRRRASRATPRYTRELPAWIPATAIGAGVLLLLGLALVAGRFDGSVATQTGGLRSFIDTQRSTFLDPTSQTGPGIDRLASAGGSRSDLYRVAIDQFQSRPLAGAGAGAFPVRWLRDRETGEPVQNAHSLPLEALAETGLIGFVLLGTAIGAIVWGAVLARRRPTALPRSMAAGVSASIMTFLASCAVDWTWQMGTLTAAMLLLASTLLVTGRLERPSTTPAGTPAPARNQAPSPRRTGRRRRSRGLQW